MSAFTVGRCVLYSALLLFLASAAQAGGSGTTLYVHCGASSGLNSIGTALRALQHSENSEPATINVTGACHENILIQNADRLTLNALQGASISDASGGLSDVIDVNNSYGFTLRGFTVTGGADTVSCYYQSSCTLTFNTIQGGLYNAVAVYPTASAFVVGGVLQNSGANGLLVRGDVIAAGVTAQNNTGNGAAVQEGGRLLFRPSDPAYDGVAVSTPAVLRNNQGNGIRAVRGGTTVCRGCSITGNAAAGVYLATSTTISFQAYYFTSGAITLTAITGNGGSGVSIFDLSSAAFFDPMSVTGNAQPEIACNTPTSVTVGAPDAAGGSANTNCVN